MTRMEDVEMTARKKEDCDYELHTCDNCLHYIEFPSDIEFLVSDENRVTWRFCMECFLEYVIKLHREYDPDKKITLFTQVNMLDVWEQPNVIGNDNDVL